MSRSSKPSQSNLFTAIPCFQENPLFIYEDSNSWHNIFREKGTNQINEPILKSLFAQGKGIANASTKVLISITY